MVLRNLVQFITISLQRLHYLCTRVVPGVWDVSRVQIDTTAICLMLSVTELVPGKWSQFRQDIGRFNTLEL